jgi:hypothetical protein
MVECIGNEQMPLLIHGDTEWIAEAGVQCRSTISTVCGDADAGHSIDPPSRSIPPSNQMIVGICNE